MLYVITALKAPWPAGAVVGDVIDLPEVPGWAVGKLKPADEGAEPTIGYGEGEDRPTFGAEAELQRFREQAEKVFFEMKAAHAEDVEKLHAALAENDALRAKVAAAEADEAKTAAALREAEEQAAQEKAALEAREAEAKARAEADGKTAKPKGKA